MVASQTLWAPGKNGFVFRMDDGRIVENLRSELRRILDYGNKWNDFSMEARRVAKAFEIKEVATNYLEDFSRILDRKKFLSLPKTLGSLS